MLIPFNQIANDYQLQINGIIHVGAYDGIEMDDYAKQGITKVVFFEAQEEIMPTLRGRVKPYPQAKAFNYCLSDKEEVVKFQITSNGQSSSMLELGTHKKLYPDITVDSVHRMECITLEQAFKKENLNIKDYDFVNIDVQGAELKVIKGMGDISHFKAFYLEVNSEEVYKDCAIVDEIDEYLFGFGFMRVLTANWIMNSWTDALYLKFK